MTELGTDYPIELAQDDLGDGTRVIVASHPDLPGCMSHGATVEEAIASLADARELYLKGLRDRGLDVPAPSPPLSHAR